MRLSKTAKRVLAYAGIWGGFGLTLALLITYPKVATAILLASCMAILLFTTWNLVSTFIDD